MIDIDAIRAREKLASPGPWLIKTYSVGEAIIRAVVGPDDSVGFFFTSSNQPNNDAFIASARADIPALISRIEELEQENAELLGYSSAAEMKADGVSK